MEQIETFSDTRLDTQCAYCGSFPESRDHVPSKILLDKPYPENLPVVPACIECNNGFSKDETYFACAIECAICGTTDIDKLSNESIKKTLKYNQRLHEKIKSDFKENGKEKGLSIEIERFENVLLKCAFGHFKFENSETEFSKPTHIWFKPIHLLSEEEENIFFSVSTIEKAPEVGSRAMQRIYIDNLGKPTENWIHVQNGVYSYLVTCSINLKIVRILIRDYLACVVAWIDTE